MMVVVVNELLVGGWLEWLTRVKHEKTDKFDQKAEQTKITSSNATQAISSALVRSRILSLLSSFCA